MENFSENLRQLCSFHRSVADVCRQIGINRQQFNKYLAGDTKPSANNLRLISAYFCMNSDDLFLPRREFETRVQMREDASRKKDRLNLRLADAFPGDVKKLRPMLGRYHSYYPVAGSKLVCRALMQMFEENGMVYTKLVERTNAESNFRRNFLSKYDGLVSYLNNRLFIVEFETLTKDTISETILTPSYRKRVDVLTGLAIGTAADVKRQPFTFRVAWKAIPPRVSMKDALSVCGYVTNTDTSIDPAIRAYFGDTTSSEDSLA